MAVREEILADGVRCFLGDCREVLPTLGRVDAVVTSPPYAQQREYGLGKFDWTELVVPPFCSIADENCQILINLGLVHEDGRVNRYWDHLIQRMEAHSWRLFGWYVWDKGFAIPSGDMNRLGIAHEWIFHFNKIPRKPAKWVRTQNRKDKGHGLRQPDGRLNGISSPDKVGQPFKIPDSVVRLAPHQSRGGIECEHPAVFPVQFADYLCRTFSSFDEVVCDPFMGSGTTGVAAVKLGRKFIGIDIESKYFDIACLRISEALKQPDFFIEKPKPVKQEAML